MDIIVGTPGRVMDMTKREFIKMDSPTIFCLDEADRMLDMGFFPDITWIIERMSNRDQTLLFSATFPQEIIDAAEAMTIGKAAPEKMEIVETAPEPVVETAPEPVVETTEVPKKKRKSKKIYQIVISELSIYQIVKVFG